MNKYVWKTEYSVFDGSKILNFPSKDSELYLLLRRLCIFNDLFSEFFSVSCLFRYIFARNEMLFFCELVYDDTSCRY